MPTTQNNRRDTMQGGFWQGSMYGLVVIAGFVILGAAIAYAMIRNRRTPREERRTEEATRRLYEEGTVGEGQGRKE